MYIVTLASARQFALLKQAVSPPPLEISQKENIQLQLTQICVYGVIPT